MSSLSHSVFLSMLKSLSFDEKKAQKIDAKRFGQKTYERLMHHTLFITSSLCICKEHTFHMGVFLCFGCVLCCRSDRWKNMTREYSQKSFWAQSHFCICLLFLVILVFYCDCELMLNRTIQRLTTDNWFSLINNCTYLKCSTDFVCLTKVLRVIFVDINVEWKYQSSNVASWRWDFFPD